MNEVVVGFDRIAGLFALMILRTPVAFAMLLVGFFGTWVQIGFRSAGGVLLTESYAAVSGCSLIVVAMFILPGNVASAAGSLAGFTARPLPGSAGFARAWPRPR